MPTVWPLSDSETITARLQALIKDATDEIVLVVDSNDGLTDSVLDALQTASDHGVKVIIAATSETAQQRALTELPDAEVVESWLDWLETDDDRVQLGPVVLIDQSELLISVVNPQNGAHAVWATGVDNGLITLARRALAASTDTVRKRDDHD